jgi:hypothetical protein
MIYTDIIIATKRLAKEKRVYAHFVDSVTNEEEFKENIRFYDPELDWVKPNWEFPQAITWEEVLSILDEVALQNKLNICKEQAKKLLAETDWAVLPDAATALDNPQEWVLYRAALRSLIANPIENPRFDPIPHVSWKI